MPSGGLSASFQIPAAGGGYQRLLPVPVGVYVEYVDFVLSSDAIGEVVFGVTLGEFRDADAAGFASGVSVVRQSSDRADGVPVFRGIVGAGVPLVVRAPVALAVASGSKAAVARFESFNALANMRVNWGIAWFGGLGAEITPRAPGSGLIEAGFEPGGVIEPSGPAEPAGLSEGGFTEGGTFGAGGAVPGGG